MHGTLTLVRLVQHTVSYLATQQVYLIIHATLFKLFECINAQGFPVTNMKICFVLEKCIKQYLHFRSKPLLNLKIFATVHSLMNDIN